ncbi:MAG: D-alanine--D-alanine ligase [Capsulimonadales bacterium]|nr:D-alanine--D-alanine ligase [Capsulimonadales bacterium]
MKRRVAVLMGGRSAERDVSLATGLQVLNALDPDRYEVYALDTASGERFLPAEMNRPVAQLTAVDGRPVNALTALPTVALAERPNVVFIALHGPGGEDGSVQGFLETLGIPYTGSGVLASALAMDKMRCKIFLGTENIVTPPGLVLTRDDAPRLRRAGNEVARNLGFPVVVKPSRQGSTYGCTVATDAETLTDALTEAFRYDDTVLVEQRIFGTEITVAVLGNREPFALPVVEIVPPDGFFDYQSKYSQDEAVAAREIVPARIDEEIAREAQEIAVRCHRLLGCRGMSRTDMFVTDYGEVITLEINTIPGMTVTSLLPKAAAAAGIPFPELMDRLIAYAVEK